MKFAPVLYGFAGLAGFLLWQSGIGIPTVSAINDEDVISKDNLKIIIHEDANTLQESIENAWESNITAKGRLADTQVDLEDRIITFNILTPLKPVKIKDRQRSRMVKNNEFIFCKKYRDMNIYKYDVRVEQNLYFNDGSKFLTTNATKSICN